MGIYNIRCYEYADSVQLRVYNRPFITTEDVAETPLAVSYEDLQEEVHTSELSEESEKVHTSELSKEREERSNQSSMNRTIQKIYEVSRANNWEYFLTLTVDRKKIDSSNYDLLCEKVSKWINNIRTRYAPDLKYIIVPELHKDGIHYHFHGLLSNIGKLKLVDSGVKKGGQTIYNLANWKYGFSTVTKVQDTGKVSSYITKYITKDLCAVSKGRRRYWVSKNCDRAKLSVFNLPVEDITEFLDNNAHQIQHASTVVIERAHLSVNYIDLSKGEES